MALHEECGIFGIHDKDKKLDVAHLTYYGLYALQHRGQETCGICVNDDKTIIYHKDRGLVSEVFNDVVLQHLKGSIAVGHVRYSSEKTSREEAQPLTMKYKKGTLTVANNSSILNKDELRGELENNGAMFQTTSDAELFAYLIAKERIACHSVEEAIHRATKYLKGAYSFIVMSPTKLIAVRDPHGMKPLCMGVKDGAVVFASESTALDAIDAKFERDLKPGEMVIVDADGVRTDERNCTDTCYMCIFEYIYFARPDSEIEGISVYGARRRAGAELAKEHPVEADVVIGVPDSGIDAAIGYAQESGIPYDVGLIKNKYMGRTFIKPTQSQRVEAVKIKLNAVAEAVKGKRVVMVDDSIVRGTTCQRIVKLLKDAGAKEVHVRVSSPPFLYPCLYGTDIPSQDVLVACNYTHDEICKMLNADSLGFLSLDALPKVAPKEKYTFCDACFTNKYPIV